jgi:hypothetical protein
MKKIIFFFILVTAIAIITGYKESVQNEKVEKSANLTTTKDFKDIHKPDILESKADQESFTPIKTLELKPRILFMLSNDKGKAGWSNSLWWSYKQTNNERPGC